MATVEALIYYPRHIALQVLIVVQTIMHQCSKVFATGQA